MIMSTWTVRSMPSRKLSTSSSMVMSSISTLSSRTFSGIGKLLASDGSRQHLLRGGPMALDQLLGLLDVPGAGGAEHDGVQPAEAAGPVDGLARRDGAGGEHRHGDGAAAPRAQRLAVGVDSPAHAEA